MKFGIKIEDKKNQMKIIGLRGFTNSVKPQKTSTYHVIICGVKLLTENLRVLKIWKEHKGAKICYCDSSAILVNEMNVDHNYCITNAYISSHKCTSGNAQIPVGELYLVNRRVFGIVDQQVVSSGHNLLLFAFRNRAGSSVNFLSTTGTYVIRSNNFYCVLLASVTLDIPNSHGIVRARRHQD